MGKIKWGCVIAIVTSLVLSATSSLAATWYIRTDGGDSTQCTGLADAPYPGSGTAHDCAFNHPFWVLPPGRTPVMAGGDTVIIGPGEYMMGAGAPNTAGVGVCNAAWTYTCVMPPVPSGRDAGHPTRILGKNWDTKAMPPPQLWGTQRAQWVLNLTKSKNVQVRYLDITDHSACIYTSPDPTKACDRVTKPYGPQADYGIRATDSANVLLKDLNIHGLSIGGVWAGRLTDWTVEGTVIHANARVGWNADVGHGTIGSGTDSGYYGTTTFRSSKIEYSGCGETYPGQEVYGCFSQGQGGYGDGFGSYYTNGDFVIEDSEFSHNTQDGLDLLYHDGTGSVTIRRSRFEGNAGNDLKLGTGAFIENTILIGNCDYFYNNPITEQTNVASFSHCRAGGTPLVLSQWKAGTAATITNSLITGTSRILIEAGGGNNSPCGADPTKICGQCDGTDKFISRNNILLGMEWWAGKKGSSPNTPPRLFYIDGTDGNGSGSCGQGTTKLLFDNKDSIAYNLYVSQCPNSNNVLCVDPMLTSIPPLFGANDIYTYGDRWNVVPQPGSPAIDKPSLPVGSTVLGPVVVPGEDITGGTRPYNGLIDWGPYEYRPDMQPPVITVNPVISPTNVSTQGISGTVADNVGVAAVSVQVGSNAYVPADWGGGTWSFNVTGLVPGINEIKIRATDTSGNNSIITACIIVIDNIPPTVTITYPAGNSTVAATVNITASASDNIGATKVEFYVNGALKSTDTAAPYNCAWNTKLAANGAYTLLAKAYDASGNVGQSPAVKVNVKNPVSDTSPPIVTITSPADNSTISGLANVTMKASDNVTVKKVELYANGSLIAVDTRPPYFYRWYVISYPNGPYILTAKAYDAAGNVGQSPAVKVTVNNPPPDTTPPTVAISSPANGSTVSGTITVTATASDNVSVRRVEFYLNGALVGTRTISPYTFTWNTTAYGNGTYTITAKAFDNADNVSQPASVTVTVNNP